MNNYESKLDTTGIAFLEYIRGQFPHIPHTQKLVLDILSLQSRLVWDDVKKIWKLDKKGRQGGRLNLEKFIARISTSEN